MARIIPSYRFADLITTATRIFIESGFRRTQMADVARELGVAKGTLYGYVEGKDALFHLVLSYADRPLPDAVPDGLPLKNPAPGELLQMISKALREGLKLPLLARAAQLERVDDIEAEFEALSRELFHLHATHRTSIKLLDRCAQEVEELRALWLSSGRSAELDLIEQYLARRISAGQIHAFPTLAVGARIWLETIITWAILIHWDRNPQKIDPSHAEEGAVALLKRGYVVPDQRR